jgi:hypothetical protein
MHLLVLARQSMMSWMLLNGRPSGSYPGMLLEEINRDLCEAVVRQSVPF